MQKLNYTEMKTMLTAERARLENLIETGSAKDACNYRKTLTACVNMDALVTACGERFAANGELYTAKRETPIFNYGSVAEQALQFLYTRRNSEKSTKTGFDHTIKRAPVEYKACLSSSSKNTPYTPNEKGVFADVLLVNTLGVWYIPAEDARGLTEKYGRFNPKMDYSEYIPESKQELCDRLTAAIYG